MELRRERLDDYKRLFTAFHHLDYGVPDAVAKAQCAGIER